MFRIAIVMAVLAAIAFTAVPAQADHNQFGGCGSPYRSYTRFYSPRVYDNDWGYSPYVYRSYRYLDYGDHHHHCGGGHHHSDIHFGIRGGSFSFRFGY